MRSISRAGLAAALMIVAGNANAADPAIRMAPAPAPAFFSWTGGYVGLQAGYSFGRDKTAEYLTATGAFTGLQWSYKANSALGGLYAGANYQFGSIVLGADADISYTNTSGGFVDPPALPLNPGGAGRLTHHWAGALRARAGFAYDRLLIYAAGGLAFGSFKYRYTNGTTLVNETTTSTRTGWTVGGGVEYAFTNNWIGRAEYRFTNFGKFYYASVTAFPGLLTGSQNPRFHTLRAGISYKF